VGGVVVHAARLARVGRGARRLARAERRRLPERRLGDAGRPPVGGRGAVAARARLRSGARRGRSPGPRHAVRRLARGRRRLRDRGGRGGGGGPRAGHPPVLVLGSGSDYTVFLNHLGVPSMDLTFDGPYGVYHSAYDSHAWMARFGDPDFAYHAAMARLWGVMALRLANADVLPFDYGLYGRDLLVYLDDVEKLAAGRR